MSCVSHQSTAAKNVLNTATLSRPIALWTLQRRRRRQTVQQRCNCNCNCNCNCHCNGVQVRSILSDTRSRRAPQASLSQARGHSCSFFSPRFSCLFTMRRRTSKHAHCCAGYFRTHYCLLYFVQLESEVVTKPRHNSLPSLPTNIP